MSNLARVRLGLVLLPLALLGGCLHPMDVRSSFDPSFDFTQIRTYAWLPRPVSGDPRINDERFAGILIEVVDDEMRRKGYSRAESESADFFVGYQVMVRLEREMATYTEGYGAGTESIWTEDYSPRVIQDIAPETEEYEREFEVGELVIDIAEGKRQDVVWRANARTEVQASGSDEKLRNTLRRAVGRMLEKFPPPLSANP